MIVKLAMQPREIVLRKFSPTQLSRDSDSKESSTKMPRRAENPVSKSPPTAITPVKLIGGSFYLIGSTDADKTVGEWKSDIEICFSEELDANRDCLKIPRDGYYLITITTNVFLHGAVDFLNECGECGDSLRLIKLIGDLEKSHNSEILLAMNFPIYDTHSSSLVSGLNDPNLNNSIFGRFRFPTQFSLSSSGVFYLSANTQCQLQFYRQRFHGKCSLGNCNLSLILLNHQHHQ